MSDPGPDPIWPLRLVKCSQCHLLQTPYSVGPTPEVPLAVLSASAEAHVDERVRDVVAMVGAKDRVAVREFPSPHGGSWMPGLASAGWVARDDGIVDVVVDVQGLVHEDDLDGALEERLSLIAPGGRYVVEFHHVLAMVSHRQLDLVRHGHPTYLSLLALQPALSRHGFVMLHAEVLPDYGGSLLLSCARSGEPDESIEMIVAAELAAGLDDEMRLAELGRVASLASEALHAWLQEQRAAGRSVLGYGAPSKAPALLCRARVDPGLLPFVADVAPRKQGRRMPVTRIPIRSPADLIAADPDVVLILTWDIASEIRSQLTSQGLASSFYVPIPVPTRLA